LSILLLFPEKEAKSVVPFRGNPQSSQFSAMLTLGYEGFLEGVKPGIGIRVAHETAQGHLDGVARSSVIKRRERLEATLRNNISFCDKDMSLIDQAFL
jgi:hypothetical protein